MRRFFLAVLIVAAAFPALAQRLPGNVVPSNYKLRFVPDLAAETFEGQATIRVTVKEPTNTIVLHASELEIEAVTIDGLHPDMTRDPKSETITFWLPKKLAAGPATIDIRYRGTLNDKLRGFYISKTARRKYAVTQMEPTDARRAFPSFDEPAMKATFEISMVVDKGDTAISNARLVKDEPGPGEGKHTLTFEKTVKMPTYLVALLVGDWECVEGSSDGIPIRVCAIPEKKELGRWGLDAAEQQLKYFNDYYRFRYPFGKLDVIGLPDFEAGAMENAGAITFRETSLMFDEKSGSIYQRRGIAATMSHEIAHMWFGDVVTMKWWDDIWLNEGFATWITPKPIAEWKPEWNVDVEEAQYTSGALETDSLAATRPIRTKASSSAEINELFDGIAYGKTAAVLRMIESYVGESTFREGIRAYIRKFAFDNAAAEDFWGTTARVTKQPIDKIMPSFVDQPGAPLVTASARCEGNETLLTLAQRRMFSTRARFTEPNDQTWIIPVMVKNLDAASAAPKKFLLTKREETFRVPGCAPHLFINHEGRGFYRAAHAPEMLDVPNLATALTPAETVALLNSAWALVRIGETDIGRHLALVDRFRAVRNAVVTELIIGQFTEIEKIASDAQKPALRAYVVDYLRPQMAEIGWATASGDTDETKRRRANLLYALARLGGDEEAFRRARELADQMLADPASVDGTISPTALALAVYRGDAALFDRLRALMPKAQTPTQYYRYLYALTGFQSPELHRRGMAMALSPEMRNQDLPGYISSLFYNQSGREATWEWLKANWKDISSRLTTWAGGYVVGATGVMCDAQTRADIERFFTANPVASSERSLKKALEQIDACMQFRTLQSQNLAKWAESRR